MATYSQSHAALLQLVAHFKEHGKPHESHGMEPCETILEIPFDESKENQMGPWAMETWDEVDGDLPIEDYRWFQGGMEVEAHEVYEALFQI